jgi:predicted transcriptional regulator
VGPIINAGVLVYPFERAAEVLRISRAVMECAPDGVLRGSDRTDRYARRLRAAIRVLEVHV